MKSVIGLSGSRMDYDPLMDLIGDARFVLLGEATHGTKEFYAERALITERLIVEKGFTAVAVEADWPAAYRLNRFVRGNGLDRSTREALGDFKRFPRWMWCNREVETFIRWLRAHNLSIHDPQKRTGFYGLDLYSLYGSITAVIEYLDHVDPQAAEHARVRYGCFEPHDENPHAYAHAASLGLSKDCEQEVVDQLLDLRGRSGEYLSRDGFVAEDEQFYAEQNARLVRDAERYYRSIFSEDDSSWNLRDLHMGRTLEELAAHLSRHGSPAKVVVWAHNSHVGDARATDMSHHGELNIGQLVRSKFGTQAVLVGFTTYQGTVSAATDWDGPVRRKIVRPALPGSYEALFHEWGPRFYLELSGLKDSIEPMLERAIGVIYRPETERASHYFEAILPRQFDAVIHIDKTHAVEPLERSMEWSLDTVPETYPSSL